MTSTTQTNQAAAEPQSKRGRGRPKGSGKAPVRTRTRKPTKREMLQALAEAEVRAVTDELGAWDVIEPSSVYAGAVRISIDRAGDGHGCARDARAILLHCMEAGIKLRPDVETGLPLFIDNNASASAIGKANKGGADPRKSYARLLRLMRDGEVQTMIFTKVDRLCRDLMDIHELCTLANDATLHGRSLTFEPLTAHRLDLNSAPLRGVAVVLATFGQMETEMTRERGMAENKDRRNRGIFTGGFAPMGMVKDRTAPGGLRPVPHEAELLVDALESVCSGVPMEAVAERWEELGIERPRAEEPWNGQQVRQRLDRATLAGWITYQPPADSEGKRPPRKVVGRGAWESIFTQAQWDALQGVLAVNRQGRNDPIRGRFTGLFVCPCGGTLYRHKQAKSGSWNWSCMSAKGGCGHNAIAGPALEAWVDAQTPERMGRRGVGTTKPTADMERLRSEMVGCDGRLAWMEERFVGGHYDDDLMRYERERTAIERKRNKADMELRTAEAEQLAERLSVDGLLAEDYAEADEAAKRRMVESAFPNGILCAKGKPPVALDEEGEPEAAAAA